LDRPDSYFLHKGLEKLRNNLKIDLVDFLIKGKTYLFRSNSRPNYYVISSTDEIYRGMLPEMKRLGKLENHNRYEEVYRKALEQHQNTAEILNNAAEKLFVSYCNLLKKAHQVVLSDR